MKYKSYDRESDDELVTDSDLNKSISVVEKTVDTHLSKLGQLLKIPISSEFRKTLIGLIVKVTVLEKLNFEKNRRKLEESFPKDMKWS